MDFKKRSIAVCEPIGISKKNVCYLKLNDPCPPKKNGEEGSTPLFQHEQQVPAEPASSMPQLQAGADGHVQVFSGTRPVINKHSLARYSTAEWRQHNQNILNTEVLEDANNINYGAKSVINHAYGVVDHRQRRNNDLLKNSAANVYSWMIKEETVCRALDEEIHSMEIERQRVKKAFATLLLSESINKECLELRSSRMATELVFDSVENCLKKEKIVIADIQQTLNDTLEKIRLQQIDNKTAKHNIEYDYGDKQTAYMIDVQNLALNSKSRTTMFKPGSVKYGQQNATVEQWKHYTNDAVESCEATVQLSAKMRKSINSILMKCGTELKTQVDKTTIALEENIARTKELNTKLEEMLRITLQKIGDTENAIDSLRNSIFALDGAMKCAQTRLDNRLTGRIRGEAVRDSAHEGLLLEVGAVHDRVAALRAQLTRADHMRDQLMEKRRTIEHEIASKRKTILLDQNRCSKMRSHQPSFYEIAGQ